MKKMLMIGAGLALAPMSVAAEPYTCEDLGYVFDKGGCLDETTMVRCPMNLERVWCVGGEMCGKYPVKGAACNDGAKIEWCDLTENMDQSSKRCKYESEDCNSGWEKGILNNVTGNTANCCKEGWELNPTTGVCEEHVCNKIRYPYTTDDYTYADYAGEIETCRSGNVINFGYVSCNNMWQRGSNNAGDAGYYKCLCKRTDYDNGYVFPFDKSTFYTTFGSGRYGDYHMCADAENSYYGYEHCFRGFEMVKSGGKKTGQCKGLGGCYYYAEGFGVPNFSKKCLHDDVCTEANDRYEECSYCTSATVKSDDGDYIMKMRFDSLDRPSGYYTKCSHSDQFLTNGYCYGTCQWQSKNCRYFDIVLKDNKPIGLVVFVSGNNYYLLAITTSLNYNAANGGFDAAKKWATGYAPTSGVCETGSGCESGKWYLPGTGEMNFISTCRASAIGQVLQSYRNKNYISFDYNHPLWLDSENGNTALMRNYWDYAYVDKNQTSPVYAYPMLKMEGK